MMIRQALIRRAISITQQGVGGSKNSRSIVLVRRSEWRPPLANSKSAPEPEKPWPTSFLVGFFGAMSVILPYTGCWWLSSNHTVRDALPLPESLLEWMRYHFGVVDHDSSASEPESDTLPAVYKFIDEPSLRLRQRQEAIEKLNESEVAVEIDQLLCKTLPGHTPATVQALQAALGESYSSPSQTISVAFPEQEQRQFEDEFVEQTAEKADTLDELQPSNHSASSMNIFSSWHVVPATASPSSHTTATQHELDSVQERIQNVQESVKRGVPLDDVQEELNALQGQKRMLQLKKWVPFL